MLNVTLTDSRRKHIALSQDKKTISQFLLIRKGLYRTTTLHYLLIFLAKETFLPRPGDGSSFTGVFSIVRQFLIFGPLLETSQCLKLHSKSLIFRTLSAL